MRIPSIASFLSFLLAFSAQGAEDFQNVVVKPGDTLWSIASVYLKDPKRWSELLKYNRLPSSDPSIALPGMVLKVPVVLIKEQYRAAKLIYYVNNVLLRKSGAADWKKVSMSMELYKSDTLRTDVDARADIKFHTGEILNLYPNSMAVLRPPDTKADVKLIAGEMRGVRSRVVTASARITPKTGDTEFGAKIKQDMTTLVQVYKGLVNVEAQGKVVEVHEGFASEVKLDMPPSEPIKLPPLPEFENGGQTRLAKIGAPQLKMDGNKFSLSMVNVPKGRAAQIERLSNTDVDMKSMPEAGDANFKELNPGEISRLISVANPIQAYHLQIARDQSFANMVLNRNYDAFDEIDLTELMPPGNYWMRVSYIDLLGFEGKFNVPRQITVFKKR
ncbi:MAG: hypothetical protein A2270_02415 [Elusimicrobia bacterium RIFOXYA12_FULL_51_18]|nr:MAG: hypothetical protein A2270_02415 [Elusimicrobia bacterium RIFOXYA12_FULL_51_18]OGS31268.1 MAG: hypothetical protein A2218_08000 [Elusimicrobia bacterium RIFOXYA2_FULL_53_38]